MNNRGIHLPSMVKFQLLIDEKKSFIRMCFSFNVSSSRFLFNSQNIVLFFPRDLNARGKKGFSSFIIIIMTRGKNNVCIFVEHVYNGEFMRFAVFYNNGPFAQP